jgi:hypothetical protein
VHKDAQNTLSGWVVTSLSQTQNLTHAKTPSTVAPYLRFVARSKKEETRDDITQAQKLQHRLEYVLPYQSCSAAKNAKIEEPSVTDSRFALAPSGGAAGSSGSPEATRINDSNSSWERFPEPERPHVTKTFSVVRVVVHWSKAIRFGAAGAFLKI